MKKSISSRIRITGTGKLMRRPMGQGHFKAKNTGKRNRMKRKDVALHAVDVKQFRKYL